MAESELREERAEEREREPLQVFTCWPVMPGTRDGRFHPAGSYFWGFVVLTIGAIWLIVNLAEDFDFWRWAGPALLIAFGAATLLSAGMWSRKR